MGDALDDCGDETCALGDITRVYLSSDDSEHGSCARGDADDSPNRCSVVNPCRNVAWCSVCPLDGGWGAACLVPLYPFKKRLNPLTHNDWCMFIFCPRHSAYECMAACRISTHMVILPVDWLVYTCKSLPHIRACPLSFSRSMAMLSHTYPGTVGSIDARPVSFSRSMAYRHSQYHRCASCVTNNCEAWQHITLMLAHRKAHRHETMDTPSDALLPTSALRPCRRLS